MLVNIAEPIDDRGLDIANCDGVGLMRTEFLFSRGLPDEETQLAAYRKVLAWARGKPVTIRTVDAGGDKPVAGFHRRPRPIPFLGLRGIRLSLSRPDVFRVQIRALLRAAAVGNLKVMFPMVTLAAEYRRGAPRCLPRKQALPRGHSADAAARHHGRGAGGRDRPELFADVAFFSIGSNDLTQYVMAAARDNGTVAALNDVANPAVLRLIANVVAFADAHGIPSQPLRRRRRRPALDSGACSRPGCAPFRSRRRNWLSPRPQSRARPERQRDGEI